MQDDAPCMYGDCPDCALREIKRDGITVFSCYGGLDSTTQSFILPCTTCCERFIPATQDFEEFNLDAFLAQETEQESLHALEDGRLGELIFGPMEAEQVCDEIMQAQSRWPTVSSPCLDERIIENHGNTLRFRFYKPFQTIKPEEKEDFQEFLKLIF